MGSDGWRMRQQDDTGQLIERTLEVWQPRAVRQLTREDARQMVENIAGFFHLLLVWDAAARAEPSVPVSAGDPDEVTAPEGVA